MKKTLFNWLAIAALACLSFAAPAHAQLTYPTAAGASVKVPGTVPLQCNSSGQACAPVTASNPAGPNQVVGDSLSGAADSGKAPVKIAGVFLTADPALTNGQRGDARVTTGGYLAVNAGAPAGGSIQADAAPNGNFVGFRGTDGAGYQLMTIAWVYNGTSWDRTRGDTNGLVAQPALSSTFWNYPAVAGGIVSSTADVAVKAAAGASVRNYVCTIDISHALLSAASEIVIKDNATVLWRGALQTAATDIGAGAGKVTFAPCLRGTANTAVNVAMITSVTGGVYANLTGYTGS